MDLSAEPKAVEVIRPQQGDVIVVQFAGRVTNEMIERVLEHMREAFPGCKALVFDEATTLRVLREDTLKIEEGDHGES